MTHSVNYQTGEISNLDAGAAERRAMKISLRLDTIADNYEAVMPMIREAIALRDDQALGYRSPGDYVSDRFGATLSRLGVEVRREVVRELTEAGLSTRAIAPVVGTSHVQVVKDRAALSGGNSVTTSPTPAPSEEGEAEVGAGQAPAGEQAPNPAPESASAAPGGAVDQPRPPVTGIDGKTYKRPEPKPAAPRAAPRRALTDQFFDAAYDLGKKAESVHRLISDDRWPQNAEKVAAKHRNDLLRIRDLLEQVIHALPSEESTRD